ncbi:MAG: TIGR04348 family glycosyltransferase [Ramlibacter sp.]|nr:TIGR04348 family glycosyltransferase [Ramlibacter sp.]
MSRPSIVIVSPALADANNGNWRTARRWQQLLRSTHEVRIVQKWPDAHCASDVAMLALHARRSADAVSAWAEARGSDGLGVVLTGTDLYCDINVDAQALRSLELARSLVVLQECGPQALPAGLRGKARVIFQSTSERQTLNKSNKALRAIMVGHLRSEKSPQTLFDAARLLAGRPDVFMTHVGGADNEPELADKARLTQQMFPHYRWVGALAYAATRQAIQRAHVLVHTSAMEGGAHVIMEAVRSGTPVLASRVPGNIGMLGRDYAGYFDHGDAGHLAHLLLRCRASQSSGGGDDLLDRLRSQCAERAHLFTPERESADLRLLLAQLHDPSV